MPLNLIFILNVISLFLLIFFSLFLLTRWGQTRFSNFLLAGFLVANTIPFFFNIISVLKTNIFTGSPTLHLAFFTMGFLMGPFIFFYTKSLAIQDFNFKKKDFIHLLPVILFLFYLLFTVLLKRFVAVSPGFIRWEIRITLLLIHVFLVLYAVKAVLVLRQFTISIKNIYSNLKRITLSWLRFVLIGFGLIWLMILINYLVRIIGGTPVPYLRDIVTVASSIVSITIIYFGLTQPKLFSGINTESKYLKSPLTSEDSRIFTENLKDLMKTEKPYLIPSLTIDHLAEKLKIHHKQLSQLVNEQFRQNFFDFINCYRIEEAKKYLSKRSRNNLTISQILYKVGFNSIATFNRAFVKHVGMSPSEFKRQNQKKT